MKRSAEDKIQSVNKYNLCSTPRITREKTMSSSSDTEKHRDPVQVFCRLRPLKDDLEPSCIKLLSATTLSLCAPSETKVLRKDVVYVYRHIFTSYATQREVFDHVALPLMTDLVKGKNGLLFTYGVTGSGKTYTLTGDQENPGIMPRCIDTLFNTVGDFQAQKYVIKSDKMNSFEVQSENDAMEDRLLDSKKHLRSGRKIGDAKSLYANDGIKIQGINENNLYAVFVSYVEIYNNTVYDLLDESTGKALQSKIIREDYQKNMYVNGVIEVEVKSAAETFDLFHLGQKRKRMAHTILNAESSRSHSIFNIRVVQLERLVNNGNGQPMIPDRNLMKVGQLSLVDLAGSERSSRTHNTGMRLKEASSINNSLMSLRSCLEILRENQQLNTNRLVPYRDSRLTLLFKNYFEGEGQVKMVVCVNPAVQDYEENLQVMKFAEMTQDVKVTRPDAKYISGRKTPKAAKVLSSIQTPVTVRKAKSASFSLGPKIPTIKYNFSDKEDCLSGLERLMKIMRMRREKGIVLSREFFKKEKHFRKRLLDINQENIVTKSEVNSLKGLFKKEKQRSSNLEVRINDLETINAELGSKNDELSDVIRSLKNTIDEKDVKLNQNLMEKQKSRQKLALRTELMNHELDAKLRRQREHLQAAMQAKDAKLQKVKEILDSEIQVSHNTVNIEQESKQMPDYKSQGTPRLPRSNTIITSSKYRRRSRSAGEVWLEHNAVKPVPLGTVLQPSMKKRKSVSKLNKASDVTNTRQNKYCLIAQETDCVGELETKLYKGDIIPTCGGGAQVVFNDVECLRQESPTGTPVKTKTA